MQNFIKRCLECFEAKGAEEEVPLLNVAPYEDDAVTPKKSLQPLNSLDDNTLLDILPQLSPMTSPSKGIQNLTPKKKREDSSLYSSKKSEIPSGYIWDGAPVKWQFLSRKNRWSEGNLKEEEHPTGKAFISKQIKLKL